MHKGKQETRTERLNRRLGELIGVGTAPTSEETTGEASPKPPAPQGGESRTLTIWTLAMDTDSEGTKAEVYMTEREAELAKISAILGDKPKATAKAIALLDADSDGDELHDFLEEYVEPLDTFSIDSHTITLPTDAAFAPRLQQVLAELVRCIRGGDATSGVSLDSALADADDILAEIQ